VVGIDPAIVRFTYCVANIGRKGREVHISLTVPETYHIPGKGTDRLHAMYCLNWYLLRKHNASLGSIEGYNFLWSGPRKEVFGETIGVLKVSISAATGRPPLVLSPATLKSCICGRPLAEREEEVETFQTHWKEFFERIVGSPLNGIEPPEIESLFLALSGAVFLVLVHNLSLPQEFKKHRVFRNLLPHISRFKYPAG